MRKLLALIVILALAFGGVWLWLRGDMTRLAAAVQDITASTAPSPQPAPETAPTPPPQAIAPPPSAADQAEAAAEGAIAAARRNAANPEGAQP